jgi:type VI secretion system protein ImpH
MATTGRPENPDLAEETRLSRWPIAAALDREPYRFEFFQAVRLLELMYPERQVVGRFTNPSAEALRFGATASVSFPASEIQSLDRHASPPLMRVNFMGLTGPEGVLPLDYSILVSERLRARDTAMRDFFDLFNHRMISLFYQAWEKYRFGVPYERGERNRFSHHVMALLGLGTTGLQDRLEVPDDALVFYSGLLSAHARSATGLRQLLADYFGVQVEIEQFVGAWYPVDRDAQCCLGEGWSDSERLGIGAVVGDEIFDQQSRVRIRFGPLTLAQYNDFLPGGEGYRQVRSLTSFYAGGEYDVELQLFLRRDEVPPCELAAAGSGPQLGWTTWVKSAELDRDPGETILEL